MYMKNQIVIKGIINLKKSLKLISDYNKTTEVWVFLFKSNFYFINPVFNKSFVFKFTIDHIHEKC